MSSALALVKAASRLVQNQTYIQMIALLFLKMCGPGFFD